MRSGRSLFCALGNAPAALIDELLSEGGGHCVHVGEDLDERSVAKARLVLQSHARASAVQFSSEVKWSEVNC